MRGVCGVVVGVALACALGVLTAPATATPTPAPDAVGLTLVHDEVLSPDGRLHELTLHSDALGRDAKARLLLPAGYGTVANAATRYPMLLLLHGAGSSERSWTEATDIEGQTAALDLIVVMPEGGDIGFYTDWLDGPQWETFHLEELVPWIDTTYRTIGTRAGRAIAGLSMGGFGSMSYPARHPDRFVAAASFSGAVNIADAGVAEEAALQALGYGDERRWGPYLTHEANWRGHNPPDLASNLRSLALRLTTGTGVPCAGDAATAAFTEAGVAAMATGFELALTKAVVPHELEIRPCGTHEWHYWEADLGHWLPPLMAIFAEERAAPAVFDYRTTEPTADVWGWSFTAHRPATEFLDLKGVSTAGLTAVGSGLVDVVTAPVYEPGATYSLATTTAGVVAVPVAALPTVMTLPPTPAGTAELVARPDGRLSFTVDLGPAHTLDQYSVEGIAAEALAVGSYFRSASVAITKIAAAPVAALSPGPGSCSNDADHPGHRCRGAGLAAPWCDGRARAGAPSRRPTDLAGGLRVGRVAGLGRVVRVEVHDRREVVERRDELEVVAQRAPARAASRRRPASGGPPPAGR